MKAIVQVNVKLSVSLPVAYSDDSTFADVQNAAKSSAATLLEDFVATNPHIKIIDSGNVVVTLEE